MLTHPRVEEVSDSDADMSDPSEGDIDDFTEGDIMRRVSPPTTSKPTPSAAPPRLPQIPQHQPTPQAPPPSYSSFACLYPLYFDSTRTRAEGRRISSSLAVPNPLATTIASACASLRLPVVFEAGKLHPKDWANPGRVRVNLKDPAAKGIVKNKHHLYLLVAEHLRENPTTEDGPALRMQVRGAPPIPQGVLGEGGKWPRPAVPRGWKIGELLPYWSPAMTGGGVSENFLKDMLKEMGGGGGDMGGMASMLAAAGAGGAGGSGSGTGGGKKDKKGKGKS